MPIILSRLGAVAMGEYLRDPAGSPSFLDGLGIALFQNDFIPDLDSVLADFAECTFGGYAPLSIITPNAAFQNGAGRGEVDADALNWTSTGGPVQTAFGYFIYNLALDVIWCQRFNAPVPMGVAGASLDVSVVFTWFTEFTG